MNAGKGAATVLTLVRTAWLTVEEDDYVVLVTATGGLAAGRAAELWHCVADALDRADGRLVAVDFERVTAFDERSINEIRLAAQASISRDLDLCAITRPNSAFDQYLRCAVKGSLPIFSSLREALTGEVLAG